LVVFGGAAVVIKVAEDRGRNGPLWGAAAMVLAGVAGWQAWELMRSRLMAGDELGVGTAFSILLAPVGVHVALATLAIKLPAPAGRTRARSWPMMWMESESPDADVRCVLRMADDALLVESCSEAPSLELAYGKLSSARCDGECLRIHWLDGETEHSILLLLSDGPRTREGRVRLLETIARRIHGRISRSRL
jgi:hypothetical protein